MEPQRQNQEWKCKFRFICRQNSIKIPSSRKRLVIARVTISAAIATTSRDTSVNERTYLTNFRDDSWRKSHAFGNYHNNNSHKWRKVAGLGKLTNAALYFSPLNIQEEFLKIASLTP